MLHGPQVIRILPITHCSNRPFYRIAVTRQNSSLQDPFIEDLGSIDPMPNKDNQILVALNLERFKYYMSRSVPLKGLVGHYLGLRDNFLISLCYVIKLYFKNIFEKVLLDFYHYIRILI
jgi:ribosomal protein S16